MSVMHKIPASELVDDDFVASIRPQNMVYFLCNVGDGDAQLLLLPEDPDTGVHQAIIIDAGRVDKIPWLIADLVSQGLLPAAPDPDDDEHYPVPDGSIPLAIAKKGEKEREETFQLKLDVGTNILAIENAQIDLVTSKVRENANELESAIANLNQALLKLTNASRIVETTGSLLSIITRILAL